MSIQAMPENAPQIGGQNGHRAIASTTSNAGFRLGRFHGEATLDDLMSDPVMPVLWQADHLKEGDVWRLIHEIADRLRHRRYRAPCPAAPHLGDGDPG
ncbi:hypothetical protein ACFPL7_04160 [Dongia soli]|uniref:Uncharacterized protein n=1 Tax=Dongia soli TaxID=600628 RepID=A0ABU5EF84_9PROT|nr:hypothetical protein [Dongia soli]MDY0884514.1 hypothetical protein [Dongia soli]